jgi:hypothetical protein
VSAADDRGPVTFLQFQKPGLHAGMVDMAAKLVVPGLPDGGDLADASKGEVVRKKLFVKGDRVTLTAGTVDSVFPPENATGDFAGNLPHVVLVHPTLPWQRTLGTDTTSNKPWLALLLLSELDLAADGKTQAWSIKERATLADLTSPGSRVFTTSGTPDGQAPKFSAEPDETDADSCITLDIATALFNQVAPRQEEAEYLAHVRELDGARKPTPQPNNDDGKLQFSIVIGSRMPPPGHSCQVFLVSLEGYERHLPAAAGGGISATDYDTVRVPVLYRWRFFAIDELHTFGEVVGNVSRGWLRLPADTTRSGADADAVESALAMGYVPVSHDLRLGGSTVSWYRGPLVPYATARDLQTPLAWADAAVRYDPTVGMMDTSAAAGWQLGRLIALNSGSFAARLYAWKRLNKRKTIDAVEHTLLTGAAAAPLAAAAVRRVAAEQVLHAALTQALPQFGGLAVTAQPAGPGRAARQVMQQAVLAGAPMAAKPRPSAADRLETLRQVMTDAAAIRAHHGHPPQMRRSLTVALVAEDPAPSDDSAVLPQEIADWLGKLALLQGVPFHYLAPDERMLPSESIRFFLVDRAWMTALIDGAFSLGRTTASDQAHDEAFADHVHDGASTAAALQRRALVGTDSNVPPPLKQIAGGFLLRSMAVDHWPGIEVEGFEANGGKANMLRLEKLAGGILLCLFDRAVAKVNVHQPPEGVHFGFEPKTGKLTKPLRRLKADNGGAAGTEIAGTVLADAPYRDGGRHVLDIAALAGWFKDKQPGNTFTAAEFALEMVIGVDRVIFDVPS